MKAQSLGIAVGFCVLLLGSPDAQRAQPAKPDILIQIHIFQKDGSEPANPNVRVQDGQQGLIKLADGTELKIKAFAIDR